MILRSLTNHVKDQNWFAVWIDFAIVVVGVFIGIQVANWNDERASKRDYLHALDRAEVEISENIAFIDTEAEAIAQSLSIARTGFDLLLSCSEAADAVQKINDAVVEIRGTRGVQTRTAAIIELRTNPALLSQQSDRVRERFADLRFYQELALDTSKRFEPTISDRQAESRTLAIQPAEKFRTQWLGIKYEVPRYALALDSGVQEACTDKDLLKWFYIWEYWQTNVLLLNEKLRNEYQKTLKVLQERER
ncbi:MAG: hypothetical protein ABJ013_04215 [Halioglobus sp.]